NDPNHLESLLKKQAAKFKNRLIVTETIFSMDGDRPPLKELILLKEKFGCEIMVDEAHATGIFGKNGSGVVNELGMVDKVDFIMGTFSKALGSFGAYIATSKKSIDYLVNTSRSFIYSTALPPSVIAANIAALTLLKKEPFRRETLLENAAYFRSLLARKGLQIKGSSQIVPLIVGASDTALRLSSLLQETGYWSLPIRPPTVQPGQARLRFSLTYHHSKELLHDLAEKTGELLNV
ncbi:MAG: aminotransferase class I/II-fold pyridoxal phosphate-dependent enzyme, partial [Planctomycetota bacterium]